MMQDTRVYNYMVRSGMLSFIRNGTEETLPVSIGTLPRNKEDSLTAYCELSPENNGLRVQVFVENDTGFQVKLQSFSIETTIFLPKATTVFCNGYQSWSQSDMVEVSKGLPVPPFYIPSLLKLSGDYDFATYFTGHAHSWSYTYFNSPQGFTLLASLDESISYTRFQYVYDTGKSGSSVVVTKDCDGFYIQTTPKTSGQQSTPVKILDFYMATGEEQDCFNQYFKLFYQVNTTENCYNRSNPALAWDSWYSLFNQVEEKRILSILGEYKVREIPLDYFIIGQGYEAQAGDWISPSQGFPSGIKYTSQLIKAAGYKPGITFSPFVCSDRSQLFRERPDFLAKDKNNRLIQIGRSSDQGGRLYLLDLYNLQTLAYIQRCIKTMLDDWGIMILKFDFLYAAGLNSGDYVKRTRAQAIKYALSILRSAAGKIPVIACGVPVGSAFGLFEYCSVAPDLSSGWNGPNPIFVGKNVRERESTLSAIKSAIGRRHLDGRAFSSDPGSFTLRKFKRKLNSNQQEGLFKTCIIFGGLISNSDSIGSYSSSALEQYRKAIIHKASRFNNKRVLSVSERNRSIHVKYTLRNDLFEDDINL
ncbi:MAG: alpha-galactosidase [Saccharofermentanales bacterium]